MNHVNNCLFVLIFCALSNTAFAQETAARLMFYGIEHAVVEYDISGVEKGNETVYFDQYGIRQTHLKKVETEKWGYINTVTVLLWDQILLFDPNKNLGQKKVDEKLKTLLADPVSAEKELLSLQILKQMGGKKMGEGPILDLPCEIWEIADSQKKMWLWKGLALRTEIVTKEGKNIIVAKKIDENITVDEAIYVIPDSIKFIDRDINEILISQR